MKKSKKVFVICSVRGMDDMYREKLEDYVDALENKGIRVHLPHRDTKQDAKGIDICKQNCKAIKQSDEVHIFYSPDSQGTHFDMGSAFAFGKKIVVVENIKYGKGKSYARMIDEWQGKFVICSECSGSGLEDFALRCKECNGVGKVNA